MALMAGKNERGQLQDVAVSNEGATFTRPEGYNWIDSEIITVSSTVLHLDADKVRKARVALVEVQSTDIRYTLSSNSVPSTTAGHVLYATGAIILENGFEMRGFRMIRDGGSDATVVVSYGM